MSIRLTKEIKSKIRSLELIALAESGGEAPEFVGGEYGFLYEYGERSGFLGPVSSPVEAFRMLADLFACPGRPVEIIDDEFLHPLEIEAFNTIREPALRDLGLVVLGQIQGPFEASCVGLATVAAWRQVVDTVSDWVEERGEALGVAPGSTPILAWPAAPPNQSQYFYLVGSSA